MTTHDAFFLLLGVIKSGTTGNGVSYQMCKEIVEMTKDAKKESTTQHYKPIDSFPNRTYLGSGPQCHSGNVDGGALAALRG